MCTQLEATIMSKDEDKKQQEIDKAKEKEAEQRKRIEELRKRDPFIYR